MHLRPGCTNDDQISVQLNRVQRAFSAELHWCNENCDWTNVRIQFELSSSLIIIGATGP